MKKLSIIAAFFILAFTANANETHTPQYKCQSSSGITVYLLIGNEFPQSELVDWSDEVKISTGEQYLKCQDTLIDNTFYLEPFENGEHVKFGNFLSKPKKISNRNGEETELRMELVAGKAMHFIYSKPGCLSGKDCQKIISYTCTEQLGVDTNTHCGE
jgi:hypothetical protein